MTDPHRLDDRHPDGRRDDADLLAYYSAALDEIYRLRAAFAREAEITKAHLALKTFPKSRRQLAEKQVDRMRATARFGIQGHATDHRFDRAAALRSVGADECLTRAQWERDVDRATSESGQAGG